MRILIATGGTGGHLFPAISLANELDCEVKFIGKGLTTHPLMDDARCIDIPSGRRPIPILRGIQAARKIVKDFDLVVGFGSWYTLPTLIAAKLARVPIVLHEANAWPGRVNRLFSRYATTGIQFSQTAYQLKGECAQVSMPIRCPPGTMSKAEARLHYGLDPEKKTLLIFGGSQGADAFRTLPTAGYQVIHLHGSNPPPSGAAYAAPFESKMEIAYAAADVVVSRAGAGTCAELLEWKLPAILIPWPGATEDHQAKNADAMVETGGALKLLQTELDRLPQLLDQAERLCYTWQRPKKRFTELVMEAVR